MNEKCVSERQTECMQVTENMSAVINNTDNLVSQLENKLTNVLRSINPPVDGKENKDEESLVPLAFELGQQKRRLVNINDTIQNILDRLEN